MSRRFQETSDYFAADESDGEEEVQAGTGNPNDAQGSVELDPLDAFMAGVNEQIKVESTQVGQTKLADIVSRDYNDDDGDADWAPGGGSDTDDDDDARGGGSGGVGGEKKKVVGLPPFDHSSVTYPPFRRKFYNALETSESAAAELRQGLELGVKGSHVPCPVQALDVLGLPPLLMREIARAGYTAPTSIQAQALPVALSGRDLIGLAKTGSGKTVTYLWPLIVHVLDQPQMKSGDGPIGVILSPTRELALQIYQESKRFAEKSANIRTLCLYGGASKWEMQKSLKEEAPEIVVATPGRLIDLIRRKSTNLRRCTMIILDEADRMFDMGFEYQMRSIVATIRPDAQKLMFSATMKKSVETFALEMLHDPVRIVVGTIGMANPDIRQVVHIVHSDEEKWAWLVANADDFVAEGKVLVFVNTKLDTEQVGKQIRAHFTQRQLLVGVECLHGDKDQADRDSAMKRFGKADGDVSILVATDVASRGLHVSDVRTVINYDVPTKIETYVHRIGRTGRMGKGGVIPGTAFTLFNDRTNAQFAEPLVRILNLSKQVVPPALGKLASHPNNSNSRGPHANSSSQQKRGLGFGGPVSYPQTSAMLADAHFPPFKKSK